MYHEALDQLENELALARAVMRRDYAQCGTTNEVPRLDISTATDVSDLDVPMYDADSSGKHDKHDEVVIHQEQSISGTAPPTEPRPAIAAVTATADTLDVQISGVEHIHSAPSADTNFKSAENVRNDQVSIAHPPTEPPFTATGLSETIADAPAGNSTEAAGQAEADIANADDMTLAGEIQGDTEQITTTSSSGPLQDAALSDTDLSSLLPGLESYASPAANGLDTTLISANVNTSSTVAENNPIQLPTTQAPTYDNGSRIDLTADDSQFANASNNATSFDDLMAMGGFDMASLTDINAANADQDNKYDDDFFNLG